MIIIGLLVGGVLKGQELIANGKVTATAAQIKAIEGAGLTFRDIYRAMPGDIANPGASLPNCTAQAGCNGIGNANGILDGTNLQDIPEDEQKRFFIHLSAAGLFSGVDATDNEAVWGAYYPKAALNGGFTAGWSIAGTGMVDSVNATAAPSGLYLSLKSVPDNSNGDGITPLQAARLDGKLDDGLPGAGGIRAFGGYGQCATAYDVPTAQYLETETVRSCGLYINIQK